MTAKWIGLSVHLEKCIQRKRKIAFLDFQSKSDLEITSRRLANAQCGPTNRANRAGAKLRPLWQVLRKN